MGAEWNYFLACVAVTLIGYAISFPRWSDWIARTDESGTGG
jgi:hypothetical protein